MLLDLVCSTRLRPTARSDSLQLEPDTEQALLAWCGTHGLLGLLPHQAEVAYLAPRWAPMEDFEQAGIPLVPTRLMYQWGYTGWQVGFDAWWQTQDRALKDAPKQEGEVVPRQFQPDYWGAPSVLSRAIGDASWATLPIEHAWGPFFPDLPEQERRHYFYPVPLSGAFWVGYAEPVSAFLEAATLFAETLQNLDAEVRSGDDNEEGAAEHRRREAHRALFSFLAGCTPALTDERTPGSRTRVFHFQVAAGLAGDDGLAGADQRQARPAV